MTASANDWRPLVAALANPDTRRVIGLLIVGEDPAAFLASHSPSRRRRIVDALLGSGVVIEDRAGLRLRDSVFAELLQSAAAPPRTGLERFLDGTRIVQYPASARDREALLRWVAGQALAPHEVVDERGMNERLAAFSDDTAVLRRYLVDIGIIERRRDGSEYALASSEPGDA